MVSLRRHCIFANPEFRFEIVISEIPKKMHENQYHLVKNKCFFPVTNIQIFIIKKITYQIPFLYHF